MNWIYENITSLTTPCGELTVTDENGSRISFSVDKGLHDCDYHLYELTEKEIPVNTETNYDICVRTCDLRIGGRYRIRLDGCEMHYEAADEDTEAVAGSSKGYSIALGSNDMNAAEKLWQRDLFCVNYKGDILPPFVQNTDLFPYDESKFVEYDVKMLDDSSGFEFRLLDRSRDFVHFQVAWIKNEIDEPDAQDEYESAVGYWTT